jgi:hypothetical protein
LPKIPKKGFVGSVKSKTRSADKIFLPLEVVNRFLNAAWETERTCTRAGLRNLLKAGVTMCGVYVGPVRFC